MVLFQLTNLPKYKETDLTFKQFQPKSKIKLTAQQTEIANMVAALKEIIGECKIGCSSSYNNASLNILGEANLDGVSAIAFDRYLNSQINKLFAAYVNAKIIGVDYPLEKPLADLVGSIREYELNLDKYLEGRTYLTSSYETKNYENVQKKAEALLKTIEESQGAKLNKKNGFE